MPRFARNDGARLANAVLGQNFDVKLFAARLNHLVDARNQTGHMRDLGRALGLTKTAIKVPKVHARWQGATALAAQVFANFVLDRLQPSFGMLAFDLELECLFHGAIMGPA